MADYGYVHNTYDMHFYPDRGPHYFYSSKSFDESTTSVPEQYLYFLYTLFADYVKRNYKGANTVPRAKITFDARNRTWVLHGYALSWNGRKVEEYFGWENSCEHNWRKSPNNDYEYCQRCHEIKCEHNVQSQLKINGVVDARWVCEACGKIVLDKKLPDYAEGHTYDRT